MNKKKIIAGILLVSIISTASIVEVKALSTGAAAGLGVAGGVVAGIVAYKIIKKCRNRRCCKNGSCSCRACKRNGCCQKKCDCVQETRQQPNCGCAPCECNPCCCK